MAIGTIKQGYLGVAEVDGQIIRCSDFNINPSQEPLFYDHTIGLRDTLPTSLFGAKKDEAKLNVQKTIWRPSVKIYQGNIAFPMTENNASTLFELAKTGDDFNLDFRYTCGISRSYSKCKVNTYTFTATAGDIVNISAEIIAAEMLDTGKDENYDEVEKLVTWDDVKITPSVAEDMPIQGMSFTVSNNCMPIYTAGSNVSLNLNPAKIRVGMQTMTGIISFYNKGNALVYLEDIDSPGTISISTSDGFSADLNVLFKPQERTGSVSAVISALSFVGVDRAMGERDA